MIVDRYAKHVVTVIAALAVLAPSAWPAEWLSGHAEAQTPATPGAPPAAPPAPPTTPAPAPTTPAPAPPVAIPAPAAGAPWWDDCTVVSKETVPASWGKLLGLAPGVFVFESDDTIRLVRTAPFEAAAEMPANRKPCKILEIKKVK